MIVTGIILLIVGVLTRNNDVWTTGIIALLLGFIAMFLGMTGHPVGRRRHYF